MPVGVVGVLDDELTVPRAPRHLDRQLEQQSYGDTLLESDSDSDLSDMGAEDVALVKMRARTPPWQKVRCLDGQRQLSYSCWATHTLIRFVSFLKHAHTRARCRRGASGSFSLTHTRTWPITGT